MTEDQSEPLADGIYFNMPEEQYFSLDRLSASGIKTLMISALQFYAENFDPMYTRRTSGAMNGGKVYHKRILEGVNAFKESYVIQLEKAACPDALDSQEELKNYCRSNDLAVGGTKAILTDRIIESDPEMKDKIFSLIQEAHKKEYFNQEHISSAVYNEVKKSAGILEESNLGEYFQGGFPEVVLLWTCPNTGVKCKARLDYLKPETLTDLKTFSNSKRKSISVCVNQAIAFESYNVQATHYMNGLKAIKKMIGSGDIYSNCAFNKEKTNFLDSLAKNEQNFVFVFQESGQVNNCIAKEFAQITHGMDNEYWGFTQEIINNMTVKYERFMNSHGKNNPWIEQREIDILDDSDFPMWMFQ